MFYLIIISVCAFALNGSSTRFFQLHFANEKHYLPLYQSLFCLIASVAFLCCSDFSAAPQADTVLCGIIGGLLFFGASFFSAKGMATGSMALSSIIVNMSLILPVLYSVILLNESLTAFRIIGFLLFLCTFVLSAGTSKSKNGGGMLWVAFVALAFLSNGMNAVVTKYYVLNAVLQQRNTFMAITYFTAALAFLVTYLIKCKKEPDVHQTSSYFAKLTLISAISAAGSFGGNLLLTYLADKVDGAILYPCINGGLCLLLTVMSCIFFREKLTLKKSIAIALGCAAIVILNL